MIPSIFFIIASLLAGCVWRPTPAECTPSYWQHQAELDFAQNSKKVQWLDISAKCTPATIQQSEQHYAATWAELMKQQCRPLTSYQQGLANKPYRHACQSTDCQQMYQKGVQDQKKLKTVQRERDHWNTQHTTLRQQLQLLAEQHQSLEHSYQADLFDPNIEYRLQRQENKKQALMKQLTLTEQKQTNSENAYLHAFNRLLAIQQQRLKLIDP